jgi:hypothetical protein
VKEEERDEEQCVGNDPLIYHETKSSICLWYLILLSIIVYLFWKTMREIDVGTKRLLSLHLMLSVKG